MSARLDTPQATRRDTTRVLRVAAAAYVLAWVVGLVIAPPRPATDEAAVLAGFVEGHAGALVVQSLLVHGLAGAALLVVAVGAGRSLTSKAAATTGALAAVLSCVQVALLAGAVMAALGRTEAAVPGLLGAVDGVDAVKLVALAGFVVAGSRAGRRARVLPRWVSVLGAVLAVLLVLGAASFVPGLGQLLGVALFAALPLLLVYVGALAWLVARRSPADRGEVTR